MSKTIDNKVVEMSFENKNFEQNANQSIKTLDRLQQKLKFQNAGKGADEAGKTIQESLSSSLDTVGIRFNALNTIAETVFTRITNAAINTGKRILSALTIDPVKTGFAEYETQINATQTILANTQKEGATIKDVNAALDELNKYADLTIYNFTEMTRNIGTFTAAGVDLKTSVDAIQGIANLAAVSGSTSQQASTAMYQLSQALASGTVKLMDWNSVVNAGMGGQVFQDALTETARVHGIAIDDMIAKEGSFRESLSQGWLTADILTETLKKFTTTGVNEYLAEHSSLSKEDIATMRESAKQADDRTAAFKEMAKTIAESSDMTEDQIYEMLNLSQTAEEAATKVKTFTQLIDVVKEAVQSGWSQSWRIMVGDFEEAKELFSSIADVLTGFINTSSEARNKALSEWKDLGGRTDIIEGVKNIFDSLTKVVGAVRKAFQEVFPPVTGKTLKNISEGFRSLTERIKITDEVASKIQNVFKGLFTVIKTVATAIGGAIGLLGKLLSPIISLLPAFMNMLEGAGEMVQHVFVILGDAAESVKNVLKDLFGQYVTLLSSLYPVIQKIGSMIQAVFEAVLSDVTKIINGSGNAMKSMTKVLKSIKIREVFQDIERAIEPVIAKMTSADGVLQKLTDSFKKAFEQIKQFIKQPFSFDEGFIQNLLTIGAGGASAFAAVKIAKGLKNVFDTIADVFGKTTEMSNIRKQFERFTKGISEAFGNFIDTFKKSVDIKMLKQVALSIIMLSTALLILGNIDAEKIGQGLSTISILMAEMFAFVRGFSKLGSTKGMGSVISIGAAMLLLAAAFKQVASVGEGLGTGIAGIVTIFTALKIFEEGMAEIGNDRMIKKGMGSLITLGLAVSLLALDVKLMSGIDWKSALVGFTGIVLIMGSVITFEYLMYQLSEGKGMLKGMGSLITLSLAIDMLALDVKLISTIDIPNAIVGLAGMISILGSIVLFEKMMYKVSEGKGLLKSTENLVQLGLAISILTVDVKMISTIDIPDVIKGIIGLNAILLSLVAFQSLLRYFSNFNRFEDFSSLTLLSVVVSILSVDLKLLSTISLWGIIKGIAGLTTVFVSLIALSTIMKNFSRSMTLGEIGGIIATVLLFGALINNLKKFDDVSMWGIIKGVTALGSIMTELVIVSNYSKKLGINNGGLNSLASTIKKISSSLTLFAIAIKLLSTIGFGGLIVTLLSIISTLTALGVAASVLAPLTGAMLALSKALAVFGAACLAIGVGCAALAGGLAILAGSAVLIQGSGEAISKALSTILTVIETVIPQLVKLIFDTIHAFIVGLADEIPFLTTAILDVISLVLDELAKNIDKIVDQIAVFLNNLFRAIEKLIAKLDWGALGKTLLLAISVITSTLGLMKLASMMKGLGKAALQGVAEAALVLAEIAGIIAAFGAINKIPGVRKLVDSGGEILSSIFNALGNAFGSFAGGFIGGMAASIAKKLPEIADSLSEFSKRIEPFITFVSSVNDSTVDSIGKLSDAMLMLTAAEFLDAVTNFGNSKSQFESLSEGLNSFADGMNTFIQKIHENGIDEESLSKIAEITSAVAQLSESAGTTFEVPGLFKAGPDFDAFVEGLPRLGDAFNTFSNSVKGVDPNVIEKTSAIGSALSAFNNLPETTLGITDIISGYSDISLFGKMLPTLGEGISSYSEAVQNVDVEKVTNSAKAIEVMAEASKKLPTDGGLFGSLSDKHVVSLSEFVSQMLSSAKSISKFSKEINGVNVGNITAVSDVIKDLVEIAKKSSTSFKEFVDSIKDLGNVSIQGFVDSFVASTSSGGAAISSALVSMLGVVLSVFSSSVNNSATIVGGYAKKIVTAFANGFRIQIAFAASSAALVVTTCISTMSGGYNGAYSAGANLGRGFGDGVLSMISYAIYAGGSLSDAAIASLKRALDINSPSKKGFAIGAFLSEGFINGIQSLKSNVVSTASGIAESARNGLSNTIAKISEMIDSDMDLQPRITPILDLSDVRNKATGLSAMFSRNKAMVIDANIRATQTQGAEIQNGVVAASGNNFVFTQNNYSPKALSRIDIYRQTRNQFSALKGLV